MHHIECTISTLFTTTRHKNTPSKDIFYGEYNWHWQLILAIFHNMFRWIIHSWWSWIHCIICISHWNFLPLHHHIHCICRRPNYFFLENFNAFQNTSIPNPEERVYLSLPHLYLGWFKRKWPKHPLSSINKKELFIQSIG